MYEIRSSRGTRSVNLFALLGAGYFFALGLLHYSKEGILTPLVCWLIPVCLLRFRLSAVQVAGGLLSAFLIFHYLVPYAEYGRSYRGSEHNIHENIADSTRLLTHPNETRKVSVETTSDDAAGYFNKPEGFWDRLQFISVDDGLINVTDQGRVFGLWPIRAMFLNAIPRVFWPNKPNRNIGNIYAHEVDSNFTDEDKTTGISYSPTAEAYHMAKWWGIFVVAPLIWILLFVVFDALIGDLRASPWGLLLMVQVAHVAPEGQLTGPIYLVTFGAEIYTFCALFATYIAPHFAVVVLGPDRRIGAVHSSLKRSWDSTIQPTLGRRFGRKAPLDATLKNT